MNTGALRGLLAFEPWQTTQMFAPVQDAAATARGLLHCCRLSCLLHRSMRPCGRVSREATDARQLAGFRSGCVRNLGAAAGNAGLHLAVAPATSAYRTCMESPIADAAACRANLHRDWADYNGDRLTYAAVLGLGLSRLVGW